MELNKKDEYRKDLARLFGTLLESKKTEHLIEYLEKNSNLPGPRANLELADAFSEKVGEYGSKHTSTIWKLCSTMSETEAPKNSPKEFVEVCGIRGIGALGSVSEKGFENSMENLKLFSNSKSWRSREAVAASIQGILSTNAEKTLDELQKWISDGRWLEMRAVAAGVGEPRLMKNPEITKRGLVFHSEIFEIVASSKQDRSSEEFKALRQGLGYTLSVIIVPQPKEGFKILREIATSKDPDLVWIAKENLKKDRLTKNFPKEVVALRKMLS